MTTKISTRKALVVRPMNDEPIEYPTAVLSSLSDDARFAHRYATRSYNSKVDRDIFDKRQRNAYVSPDAPRFTPTERMLAAFAELESVGLGSWDPDYGWLRAVSVHEQYTVANGRGSQLIKVSSFTHTPNEGSLLAVLVGGDIESGNPRPGITEIVVRARHENATDFEHDASSTAQLTIRNPSPPEYFGYGHTRFTGVLTEARLYPLGLDPLTVSDADTRAGEACDTCDEKHPFAPYQPPVVNGLATPVFVVIETYPIRPYLVADAAITPIVESETA